MGACGASATENPTLGIDHGGASAAEPHIDAECG
jgi:hypothetical protein